MPERRRTDEQTNPLNRYRAKLVIDRDDLDTCMVEQPELVDHVGEAYSNAVAERDAGKLELEIAEAEEAQKIRDHAAKMEEKLTEAAIREQLILSKRIQRLKTDQIVLKKEIDDWAALREAFQARGFMLRELAPMWVARFNRGTASSYVSPRQQIADTVKGRADSERAADGRPKRRG